MKIGLLALLVMSCGTALAVQDYPLRAVDKGAVKLTHGFWFDRVETNRTATLRSNWAKCHETSRIANFTNAAVRAKGKFHGIPFDDSDVFKVIEGSSYILASNPDPELERFLDIFVGEIGRAQEEDGYLYTARTLGYISGMTGPERWSNCAFSHELYNVGHLYEAAVARYENQHKDDLLKIACKNADLVCKTFGSGEKQLKEVPGHEEIELGLVKLYRATGVQRYLEQAQWFLDHRGRGYHTDAFGCFTTEGELVSNEGAEKGNYDQNHRPVVDQREAVGHAVRACYLYCAMADVAAITGNDAYAQAITSLWKNVVAKKLHLHGGIGANPKGEKFGADYELPNEYGRAYDETCAQIANVLWNDRLFRGSGEAKYMDVAELTLYNGFASGIALKGNEYFYPNPLASRGEYRRSKWFDCSCCPVNDLRMIPQIPTMAWATNAQGEIFWNLFMAGTVKVGGMELTVETDYPWSGKVKLMVTALLPSQNTASQARNANLKLRIPGWALGKVVPSDLYTQSRPTSFGEVAIAVNGRAVNAAVGLDGYVTISRPWQVGDQLTLELPMPVQRVKANDLVTADRGRLAVMRGPILYCAEGYDNDGCAYYAELPADATFKDSTMAIGDKTYPTLIASNGLRLIPYCLWGNRQPGNELQCWFRERVNLKLDACFTDHAVFQRDQPVLIRGQAKPGELVELRFGRMDGQDAKVAVNAGANGRWTAYLPGMSARWDPQTLRVKSGDEEIWIGDVVIGEVWIASGQSNMEMPLWNPTNKRFRDKLGGLYCQLAGINPHLRVVMTHSWRGVAPNARRDYPVQWTIPNHEWLTENRFSALAYYFGRELMTTINVPVGIIVGSWGGTSIETWVPDSGWDAVKGERGVDGKLARVQKRIEEAKKGRRRDLPEYPGDLWNEQISVFAPYTLRGMIWYQGESDIEENRRGGIRYSTCMKALHEGWKTEFQIPELPIIYAELAPFAYFGCPYGGDDDSFARLLAEQHNYAESAKNAYIACTGDIGDVNDIHPNRKFDVAARMAALAYEHVYGLPVEGDSPRAVAAKKLAPGTVEITLEHNRGLYRWMQEVSNWTERQTESSPFRFIDANGRIVDGQSEIQDGRIIVTSEEVLDPVFVTYKWRCRDESNIFNDSTLPLGSFKLEVR